MIEKENVMSEQNKAIMRRIYDEIWNEGKLEAIDEIFSPDYVAHFLPPGMPPGRDGFRQFVTMYRGAFPDVHAEVRDQVAEGDKVVTRFTLSGTHSGPFMGIPATRNSVKMTAVVITRFQNGRNVEGWAEQDRLGLMQQLGVVPAPQ
jgi:steroid delta-isomerase-like uncharacterized protein